jgi:DNA-binding SARP family transcriptional activator
MADAGRPAILVADAVRLRDLPGPWRDAVAAHGARELDTAGDGLALAFPSTLAALAYAKKVQRSGDLGVRIGMDLEEGDDPRRSKAVAARLAARAERGQVLVSPAVHALAVGSPGHEFRELGTLELDGLGDAIRTWELLWQEPEPRTSIRLCGPLALEVDGRDLASAIPGGQASVLLGYLAAKADRAADRDELIDVLWPERPPSDPHAALRPVLSRLRRALAPATLEGRERLRLVLPEPVWIDVDEATRAIETARAAARSERWENAREESEAALGLLRRGLLPAHEGEWLDIRRREVEELELEALEWLARSSLALGGPELAAAERASRELVARSRFRETGYRFLMEALAAGGNVAEALRVYERLRVLLRDELGTGPAPEVQALHRRLLAGEPTGAPTETAETPEPDGLRRIPLPGVLSPRERSAFVGRERELEVLRAAWRDACSGGRRLAVVAGEPGIGKTRLTRELALEAHEHGTVLSPPARRRPSSRTSRSSRRCGTTRAARTPPRPASRSARAPGSSRASSPSSAARVPPSTQRRRATPRRAATCSSRPSRRS